MTQPSFACPRCGYETFLPSDVHAGYCPMCAWWTGDSLLGSDDVLAQAEIDGPFATTAPLTSPLDAIHERPYCSTCGRLADVDIMEWTSATPVAYACEEHGEIRGDGSGEALPEIDPVMAHEIGVIAALRAQRFDRRTQYTPRSELETDWFGAPITRNAPRDEVARVRRAAEAHLSRRGRELLERYRSEEWCTPRTSVPAPTFRVARFVQAFRRLRSR